MNNITGKAYLFGKNIDTDQIYPGMYLEITDHQEIAKHCLEGADSEFPKRFEKGGIVVALENFGCGSSREHAAITLKTIGVTAVIAKSFARIFYRNGINMGLPLIECKEIDTIATEGCELCIDFENSVVINVDTKKQVPFIEISEYASKILAYGGIKKMMIDKLQK